METVLEYLCEQVDTRFEEAQGDYRALIMVNPHESAFTGPAILEARVPLKLGRTPRKASVWDVRGIRLPCQIKHSNFQPLNDPRFPDGTLLWRFELWFWVEDIPPRSYATYRAEWGDDELPLPEGAERMPPLRTVKEAMPHSGNLPKSGAIPPESVRYNSATDGGTDG